MRTPLLAAQHAQHACKCGDFNSRKTSWKPIDQRLEPVISESIAAVDVQLQ